ncbi:MAG: DNA repair protein RadC [Acholeplasmataceae bacterium]
MNYLIRDIPIDERPRERLIRHGVEALSNVELLALLLKTGNKGESALELSRKILYKFNNKKDLLNTSVEELMTIEGIGIAKASTIVAAIELFKRVWHDKKEISKYIINAADVYYALRSDLEHLESEHFYCLYLDIKNKLISKRRLFVGGLTGSLVSASDIFKHALRLNAAKVIFAHNHPSGNPEPSQADIDTTRKLIEGGKLLGIAVLDHVIIGKNNCFSIIYNKKHDF